MRRFRNNKKLKKFFIGLLIGNLVASISLYYSTAVTYDATSVSYDNSESGLTANNVQSAINEIYAKEATRLSELNTRVGSAALNTTATNISGAVNEIYGKRWIKGTSASTSGAITTLPSAGAYLLTTGHTSNTGGLNTIWSIRTDSNFAVCMGYGGSSSNITVSVSGTSVTVTTTSGTVSVEYLKLY